MQGLDKACCVWGSESRSEGLEYRVCVWGGGRGARWPKQSLKVKQGRKSLECYAYSLVFRQYKLGSLGVGVGEVLRKRATWLDTC